MSKRKLEEGQIALYILFWTDHKPAQIFMNFSSLTQARFEL